MVCGRGPSIGKSIKGGIKKIGNELKRIAPDLATGGVSTIKRGVDGYLSPELPDITIASGGSEVTPYIMPDQEELRKARRRRGAVAGSGRTSTILSGGDDRLGG